MSSPIPYTRDSELRSPASRRPRAATLPAALTRLFGLGLGLMLLTAAGCTAVGEGPEPDAAVDMSRTGDLVTPPLCSAKNCAGCCLGDVCQPGITTAACGTAGATCSQCSDAQKCGTDFQCAFDPSGTWLVAVTQATLATTNATGMQWRADGTMPRPLVQFDVSNRTAASDIVVTGTAPSQVWTATWGAGFTYAAKDLLSTGFDLQVLDQLTTMTTQPMSSKHHVTLSQQDFVTKKLTYQGWEGVKTLSLVLQRK